MKAKVFLPLLFMTFQVVAQFQPGVYRYTSDQNAAKVTLAGNVMTLTAWRTEIIATLVSPNRYEDQYGDIIEVVSKDLIRLGYKDSPKSDLTLYCPEGHTNANSNLFSSTWNGDTYFASKTVDKKFEGEYLYEGGEPKVQLNLDGTGYFQRHQVAPDAIKRWGVETNYKGEVQKIAVGENEKIIILVEYVNGQTDRMQVVVLTTPDRKIVIMGERVKTW